MKQQKFKVGDRVRAIKPVGNDKMLKVCGTVVGYDGSPSYPYLVEFDKYINGHGGIEPFTGKIGFCWWCDIDDIEPINQPKKKRGRPVGSKNKGKVELEPEKLSRVYSDKAKNCMPDPIFKGFETSPTERIETYEEARKYRETVKEGETITLLKDIKGLLEKLVNIQTNEKQFDIVEWFKDILEKN